MGEAEGALDVLCDPKGWPGVRSRLRLLGVRREDREDVMQDYLLRLVRSWERFDPSRGRAAAWANEILVHTIGHHLDRAAYRREVPVGPWRVLALAEEPTDPDIDQPLDRHAVSALVRAAVERALAGVEDPTDAAGLGVFLAHDRDGEPMAEIASRLGVPLATAYRRRARGSALLRREMLRDPELRTLI